MAKNNSNTGGKGEPAAKRYNRGERGTHPLDKDFQPKPEGVVEVLGGDDLQTLSVVWRDDFSLFQEGSFWHDLEIILGNCDKVMLRHGWDRHAGNGRNFPGDRTAEPFSELWYAGKIGFECWNLFSWHRVHGPNEIALSDAMRLGQLLAEAEWRAAFKPAIVTGKAQRKTLSEHREKAIKSAQDNASARRALVAEIMGETSLTGGALDKWLQRNLEERHEITVSTRTIRSDKKALSLSAKKLGKVG